MPSTRPSCRQHRGLDSPLGGAREHRLREGGSYLSGTFACRQQRQHQPRSNPAFVVLQGKTTSFPQMREAHAMHAGLMLPMRIGMSREGNPRNLWHFCALNRAGTRKMPGRAPLRRRCLPPMPTKSVPRSRRQGGRRALSLMRWAGKGGKVEGASAGKASAKGWGWRSPAS